MMITNELMEAARAEQYQENWNALAIAIVQQAARDGCKTFFTNKGSLFRLIMPNMDGDFFYNQIQSNFKEFDCWRKLTNDEIAYKYKQFLKRKFLTTEDGSKTLSNKWWKFYTGTKQDNIIEWFDSHYPGGVEALNKYEYNNNKKGDYDELYDAI